MEHDHEPRDVPVERREQRCLIHSTMTAAGIFVLAVQLCHTVAAHLDCLSEQANFAGLEGFQTILCQRRQAPRP